MNLKSSKILLLGILLLIISTSFCLSHKDKNNLYGRWNATSVYPGKEIEESIQSLNSEQTNLLKTILDSTFIPNNYVEFFKNGKYKSRIFGKEIAGLWVVDKYIIKLCANKDTTHSLILEIKPDELRLLLSEKHGSYISYTK